MVANTFLKLTLLLTSSGLVSAGGQNNTAYNDNYFVGSQSIYGAKWDAYRVLPFAGHEYSETGFDMLTEMRESMASAAMNQFKFKLSNTACDSYRLNCAGQDGDFTLKDLAQETEVADTLGDVRFKWYHIWAYSFNMPKPLKRDMTQDERDAEYEEMYELTTHLLETYEDTGKTFYIGNWEGDWELMWASGCRTASGFDMACHPSADVVARYHTWAQIRQNAIDDAKEDMRAKDVHVFHYIEFNLAQENFEDGSTRPSILNSIVPYVNPDYLSYSAYKSTNRYINHEGQWFNQGRVDEFFYEVLNYAESKLSETETDFSVMGDNSKRVFIGEFGPGLATEPTLARTTAAEVIRASLEWGCPFVLQWELYDNLTTMPLVLRGTEDMHTDFNPIRQLYLDWGLAAREYVRKNRPTSEGLRLFAVDWFTEIQQQ
jgi:hypothetical protein